MSENNAPILDESLTEAWNNPAKLPEMSDWLKESRSEAAQSQYAFIVLKKHLVRGGANIKQSEIPTSWASFNWLLYLNIDEFVHKRERSLMLRNLFVELVDFAEASCGEYFVYYLHGMLENFIDRDPPRALILPLLPDKALEKMDEMHEMLASEHEEYLRRLDQMGY